MTVSPASAPTSVPLLAVSLDDERAVVLARQRAREVAQLVGFDPHDQTRFATIVSEIARNAWRYAGGGEVTFCVERDAPDAPPARDMLLVRVRDAGPGIPAHDAVLEGRYRSTTGMGIGIVGARRLSDRFQVHSAPGEGTDIVLGRRIPPRVPTLTVARAQEIADELARRAPLPAHQEMQAQNAELLRTLDELRARQEEVERLNRELEETNRGVLALYSELENHAEALRRASELKSSFLSNVRHELRSPLASIINLSRLLLDHEGTDFGEEQRRQAKYIRQSGQALFDIVNDLLDLAKIEAGKSDVRAGPVNVAELLGTLRGVFRPLLATDAVALRIDPVPRDFEIVTDEGKLSQVLRNFLSNAVKFTERGEIRLRATPLPDDRVELAVTDTGIGIAPEHLERAFEEFVQIESPLQGRVKGTGLGLPLTRKIARLLGGEVTVRSAPGTGSTFAVVIPRRFTPAAAEAASGPEHARG